MDTTPYSCSTCRSGDPERDANGWNPEAACIDESHFGVCIMRCPACGARALHVIAELIDWDNGNDSQAVLMVPLAAAEAIDPEVLADEGQVSALLAHLAPCDFLVRICPRGTTDLPAWEWRCGTPFIMPHD